jgi:phosphoglycerol transferase MdoB-like AlkP superfamily enzyme
MRAFAGKIFAWFTRMVSSSRSSFAFLVSLLTLALAYRGLLSLGLFTSPIRPFDFSPGSPPLEFTLKYGYSDLALVLAFLLLVWVFSRLQFFPGRSRAFMFFRVTGFIFLHLILFGLLCVHLGHLRLLFDVQTGLDYSIIQEAISSVSTRDILKFLEIRDYLFLFVPIGIFWLVFLSPLTVRVWAAGASLAAILLWVSLSVLMPRGSDREVPPEIRLNPAFFLLADTAQNTILKPSEKDLMVKRLQEKVPGIQLTSAVYAYPFKATKILPPKPAQRWNVVFLVMESLGTRYMFDTANGHPIPMPFLQQLSREGWYLRKHYTTSNVSTKAVFSIFSGLYDLFHRGALGTRPEVQVPSLYNFLGEGYDSFLVTPSSSSWYFPAQFMKNSGLREMYTYENLNFRVREELHSLGRYIARDEIQTVDFFIQRLSRAREPFLGIYISFAAHFPYFDYGPDFRVRENDGRLISRYYNNLNLLDRMIKRIHEHLQKQGLLKRTILVIVGDHGQAFGQHHPDNYLHYRYSYNVNLEAPAVFWQPALFQPRMFDLPTHHVDLLPTLLDAMRVPYDPALLDGESLFQRRLKRKYLFFYGLEESISCLDTQGIKVQYSLKKNRCGAFDLKRDPDEENPLDCSAYQPQLEALRQFVSHHDTSLVQYNASVKERRDFQGHKHPGLALAAPRER